MPSDILGTSIFNPDERAFTFKHGPIFAQVVLIDEVNRAPAKTQAALFEVMEEQQVTVDGHTYPLSPPFLVLATQNPLEHEGTYRLPEAQLDRFLFKINVPYPSLEQEVAIVTNHHAGRTGKSLDVVSAVVTGDTLVGLQQLVRQVHVTPPLLEYMAAIVHQTRNDPALLLGASPRATVALLNASKAMAVLAGRDYLLPDDVQRIAQPVLGHRMLLVPEQEMAGKTTADVVRRIIAAIDVPR